MTGRWQSRRLWLGGGAGACVLIVLVAWFAFINPQRTAAAANRDELSSVQLQNDVLQTKNARLKKENDSVATLRAGLAAALAELPSDGGLADFTRQLSAQATANSVALTSVIVGAVTPVAAAAGQGAAAAPPPADSTASTPTTAAGTATAPAAGSLVKIPISVIATGLGKNDIAFLKAIQVSGPRRALVTASQLAPSGGGAASGIEGPCTLTLTLTIFSAPLTPTAQTALQKLLSGK